MFGRTTLLASVACILLASVASAQEWRASIAGTDASGAVVANTRVRLINTGTAVDYDTLTTTSDNIDTSF
jgi:hypothetical protein